MQRNLSFRLWNDHIIELLPAYLALSISVGAGAYCLALYLDMATSTAVCYLVPVGAILLSFGSMAGIPAVQRICNWGRLGAGIALAVSVVPAIANIPRWADTLETANTAAVVAIGISVAGMILCVGTSRKHHPLPVSMPLIGVLALFGLLHILAVDTETQFGFLLFIAMALFLVAYERHVWRLHASDHVHADFAELKAPILPTPLQNGENLNGVSAAKGGQYLEGESGRAKPIPSPTICRLAIDYFLAGSVWFGILLCVSLVIYVPLQIYMPRLPGSAFGRSPERSVAWEDWRGTSTQMTLHGGTHFLSDREIQRVSILSGESDMLWRGRVFEEYADSKWKVPEEEINAPRVVPNPSGWTEIGNPGSNSSIGHTSLMQAFVEPATFRAASIAAPGEIQRVKNVASTIRRYSTGALYAPFMGNEDSGYEVESQILHLPLASLLAAPGLSTRDIQQWKDDPNKELTLALPDDEKARAAIFTIATQIQNQAEAAGSPLVNPYEKAQAIHKYLVANCRYSLVAPEIPFTDDAVAYFLTQSKLGACDLFASSEAVLLRAMNVPTRVATGYLQPDPEPLGNGDSEASSASNAKEVFIFRERDAHAWTEYYVPKVGWIPYDPTEGTQTSDLNPTSLVTALNENRWKGRTSALFLPTLGLVLLAIGGLWSLYDLRQKQDSGTATHGDVNHVAVEKAYHQALKLMKSHVPLPPHYSPQEYEAAVHATGLSTDCKNEFAALTYLWARAHYAPSAPAVEQAQLEACLARLAHDLKVSKGKK